MRRARFGVALGVSAVLHLVMVGAVPWRDRSTPVRVAIIDEGDIHGTSTTSTTGGEAPDAEREVVVADGDGDPAEEEGLAALSRLWEVEEEARNAEEIAHQTEVRAQLAGRIARREMEQPRRVVRRRWTPGPEAITHGQLRPKPVVATKPEPPAAPVPPPPPAEVVPPPPVAAAIPPTPEVEARKLDANLARAEAEARKVLAELKRAEAETVRREVEARIAARAFEPPPRAPPPKPLALADPPDEPAPERQKHRKVAPAPAETRPPPATATPSHRAQTAPKPTAGDRVATPAVKPLPHKPKATGTTPPTERKQASVAPAAERPAAPKPAQAPRTPAANPAPRPTRKANTHRKPSPSTSPTPGKHTKDSALGGKARADQKASEEREAKARRADTERDGRADGEAGGTGTGAATRWLRYVHTDGTPSGDPVTDALYIGGRDVFVARQTWAPTNTERSFGSGKVRGDAIPGVEIVDAVIGFEGAEPTPDADGLFLDGTDDSATPSLAGADARAPIGEHLHLSMLLTDPGDGTSPPLPERHSPRTNLPRPTREAPIHKTDGVAITPSAGADAPPLAPEEDSFWSPIVGEEHTPAAGAARRDGTAWSSLEVVDETLVRGEVGSVKVQKTEVGVWMDGVDDRIRKASRMPVDLRALGYSGVVKIDLRVRRNGTIEHLRVVLSSGVLELDELAIAAIPEQVDPPPIRESSLALRYTFTFGT